MTSNQAPSFSKNLIGLPAKALERFTSHFRINPSRPTCETLGPCWEFTKYLCKGYGRTRIAGFHETQTHRFSYELEIGPIPEGHDVHHKCENPPCGRPEHLEALPKKKHFEVSPNHNKNVTHCPQGHLYDEANTYHNAKGHRGCRECILGRQKEQYRVWREANPLAPESIATHCPKGHEYTDENMQFWKGERRCRRCKADWANQKYKANHEANKAARRAKWAENAEAIAIARRAKLVAAFPDAPRRLKRRQAVESKSCVNS